MDFSFDASSMPSLPTLTKYRELLTLILPTQRIRARVINRKMK